MAYSATLSHIRGFLSTADHRRLLSLFSRAGLSMDHPQFDSACLEKATQAILKTRDGKLRAAVPVSPMGKCVFLNDVSHEEMSAALDVHKHLVKEYPRAGAGIEAYVDGSDTGYNAQGRPVEEVMAANGFVDAGRTDGFWKSGTTATVQEIKELMGGCEHMHVPEAVAVANGSS
jgi:3-dehydroquinate synthase